MPSYESSDGSALHYDDVRRKDSDGDKCPVILTGGGAARRPSYFGDLAGLSDRHRLIVSHQRGVGRTPAPDTDERRSFLAQADDIEHLRVHLGLDRVVQVAHSAGTRLTLACTVQFTLSVARLVLITPPAVYLVNELFDTHTLIGKRRGDSDFEAALAALDAGPRLVGISPKRWRTTMVSQAEDAFPVNAVKR
ncbi:MULTISPECIES: alpha/beta fold hydrolase [Cryobacterium]|uniref:Alpha/beta fold hydrolase n=1 Tax=Cryobacterium breve TaxID=1259258 RepID=A0ABY2J703_9MICO|nr:MULTISPECIES: alpha/beta fold hydrolase [Cryobacterium]TFC92498.1 alpha/beta fold hydrolase [Cryobacterium sp. TmT3-12]TFC99615.1 alpha/beta fold hydrolase [Cryobacterium breve]